MVNQKNICGLYAEPKYRCKFCGALYLHKDLSPACCNRAFHAEGNSALVPYKEVDTNDKDN